MQIGLEREVGSSPHRIVRQIRVAIIAIVARHSLPSRPRRVLFSLADAEWRAKAADDDQINTRSESCDEEGKHRSEARMNMNE